VTRTNVYHGQKPLPVIRLLKLWNRRTKKPRLPSFLFEVLVLRAFDRFPTIESALEVVAHFFWACPALLRAARPFQLVIGSAIASGMPFRDWISKLSATACESSFASISTTFPHRIRMM